MGHSPGSVRFFGCPAGGAGWDDTLPPMKPLIWTAAISFVVGVAFAVDGIVSMRSAGEVMDINFQEYRDGIVSLSFAGLFIGIAILAGLLALHAHAIGQQTRRAFALHEATLENQRLEELRREQASRLRVDHRS